MILNLNPETIQPGYPGFQDVRNIGHRGTGDVAIKLTSMNDLRRIKPLLLRAHEES